MAKSISYLIKTVGIFLLILSYSLAYANEGIFKRNRSLVISDFALTIQNIVQTASNKFEFDVYLLDTDPSQPFELASMQLGFRVNSLIYTGGTLTVTYNNAGSGLNSAQLFKNSPSVVQTIAGYPNQSLIRLSAPSPVTPGSGTIISQTGLGTLVNHFIITSSVNFANNSTPNLIFDSNSDTSPLYATRVSQFISGLSTQLPVTPSVNATVNGTLVLNQNVWKGTSTNDWNTAGNWSSGNIPNPNKSIVFDNSANRNCLMDNDHSVANIVNNSVRQLITNGKNLTINGNLNFTNGGQIDASITGSTITFSGSTTQSIPTGVFVNNSVYNLTINNSNNVILNGSLNLMTPINATSGKLDAVYNSPSLIVGGSSEQSLVSTPFLNGQINNLTIDNTTVTLNSDLTVNSLTIINGKSLIISPVNQLNVTGTISNWGTSGLVIKAGSTPSIANGSLIFHNDVNLHVPATVEMNSIANWTTDQFTGTRSNYKWEYFGIPVQMLVASPTFDGAFVRQHNEAGSGSGYDASKRWIQLVNGSLLTPFAGYEIVQSGSKTYSFTGDLVNSDYPITRLSFTDGVIYQGQHIFSNPYTAAINISQLNLGSSTDGTIYLYNTGSLSDWSSNNINGTSIGNSPGQYTSIPKNIAGQINGIPDQIPSMQGFLVMATDGTSAATFGIPYSAVIKNSFPQRTTGMKNIKTSDPKVYTIIDVTGKQFTDRMWLISESTCSHAFDNGWDGTKLLGSSFAPQLYAIETDGIYQVNTVDDVNNTYLGFRPGIDSIYTLSFNHQNTDLRYQKMYLMDLTENKTVDITSTGSEYRFITSSTASDEKRFKIIAIENENEVVTDLANKNHSLTVYNSGETIFINNQNDVNGTLYLFDLTGRLIQKFAFTTNGITTFSIHLPSGTYLSKAVTSLGQIITKLIF